MELKANTAGKGLEAVHDSILNRVYASTAKRHSGRFSYIIGNNGTGKSRLLARLASTISESKPPRTVACISNSIHDRFTYSESSRVKYLGARNASNAVFLSSTERNLCRFLLDAARRDRSYLTSFGNSVGMDFIFIIPKDFSRKIDEDSNEGRRKKNARVRQELSTKQSRSVLTRVAESDGNLGRFTDPQLRVLSLYVSLGLEVRAFVSIGGGKSFPFSELSSGEQNRALLFAKIISAAEEGSVFLVDEPELSLHLHWQMDFHRTVEKLLEGVRRYHVVVATHAPVVISEAAKHDPDSLENSVVILRNSDRNVPVAGIQRSANKIVFAIHSFSEVASHDQLVLRYFHTAPYHSRGVSLEITETVLDLVEGSETPRSAKELLMELQDTAGISDEAIRQIDSALKLIDRDILTNLRVPN